MNFRTIFIYYNNIDIYLLLTVYLDCKNVKENGLEMTNWKVRCLMIITSRFVVPTLFTACNFRYIITAFRFVTMRLTTIFFLHFFRSSNLNCTFIFLICIKSSCKFYKFSIRELFKYVVIL